MSIELFITFQKNTFQKQHIPNRRHSKEETFQRGDSLKTVHSKDSIFQKEYIPKKHITKRAHSKKNPFN